MSASKDCGVYVNGSLGVDYYALPYFSYSGAKLMAEAPAVYRFETDNPSEPTAAMLLGDAVHKQVLQPSAFDSYYAVFAGERRAGKAWEAFQAENQGRRIIKKCEADTAREIALHVLGHEAAGNLLDLAEHRELTLIWEDTTAGRCKAKVDFYLPSLGIAGDLKTTCEPGPEFRFQVNRLRYHWQAAHYISGLNACGLPCHSFVNIAVGNKAPYLVSVHQLGPRIIARGAQELDPIKKLWAYCVERNVWPGFSEEIEQIEDNQEQVA